MTRKLPADIASPEDRGAVRPDMVSTGAFTFSDWCCVLLLRASWFFLMRRKQRRLCTASGIAFVARHFAMKETSCDPH
jgi:hypothetical protein